ncbi:MAG: hypothetical protein ABIK26_07165, partial [Candidatus Omnitrophota bacterium]
DAFGMAGSVALITSTPISGQSISTMIRNSAIAYSVPKLLNKPLGNLGASFVGGALSGGFALGSGGFNFKWNTKAMVTQGFTSAATVGVTEYGYKQGWDRKLPGLSNLAGNLAGNITSWGVNRAFKVDWGTAGDTFYRKPAFVDYKKNILITAGQTINLSGGNVFSTPQGNVTFGGIIGNKVNWGYEGEAPKVSSRKDFVANLKEWKIDLQSVSMNKYLPTQINLIRNAGFQPGANPGLRNFLWNTTKKYLAEGGKIWLENTLIPSNEKDVKFYHKAAGNLTSGIISGKLGNQGIIKTVAQGAISGMASAGLKYLSKEMQKEGFNSHTAAMLNLGLTAGIRSGLSTIEGEGSRWSLTKAVVKTNMMGGIGSFATFGSATLTPTGDLYYSKSPDAAFYGSMHDFYRTAEGMPNSSWTRNDWQRYDSTGIIPENTKGLGNALASRFSSSIHYEAVGNITTLVMDKWEKIKYKKIDDDWWRAKSFINEIKNMRGVADYQGSKKIAEITQILEGNKPIEITPHNLQIGSGALAPLWNPQSFTIPDPTMSWIKGRVKVGDKIVKPTTEVTPWGTQINVPLAGRSLDMKITFDGVAWRVMLPSDDKIKDLTEGLKTPQAASATKADTKALLRKSFQAQLGLGPTLEQRLSQKISEGALSLDAETTADSQANAQDFISPTMEIVAPHYDLGPEGWKLKGDLSIDPTSQQRINLTNLQGTLSFLHQGGDSANFWPSAGGTKLNLTGGYTYRDKTSPSKVSGESIFVDKPVAINNFGRGWVRKPMPSEIAQWQIRSELPYKLSPIPAITYLRSDKLAQRIIDANSNLTPAKLENLNKWKKTPMIVSTYDGVQEVRFDEGVKAMDRAGKVESITQHFSPIPITTKEHGTITVYPNVSLKYSFQDKHNSPEWSAPYYSQSTREMGFSSKQGIRNDVDEFAKGISQGLVAGGFVSLGVEPDKLESLSSSPAFKDIAKSLQSEIQTQVNQLEVDLRQDKLLVVSHLISDIPGGKPLFNIDAAVVEGDYSQVVKARIDKGLFVQPFHYIEKELEDLNVDKTNGYVAKHTVLGNKPGYVGAFGYWEDRGKGTFERKPLTTESVWDSSLSPLIKFNQSLSSLELPKIDKQIQSLAAELTAPVPPTTKNPVEQIAKITSSPQEISQPLPASSAQVILPSQSPESFLQREFKVWDYSPANITLPYKDYFREQTFFQGKTSRENTFSWSTQLFGDFNNLEINKDSGVRWGKNFQNIQGKFVSDSLFRSWGVVTAEYLKQLDDRRAELASQEVTLEGFKFLPSDSIIRTSNWKKRLKIPALLDTEKAGGRSLGKYFTALGMEDFFKANGGKVSMQVFDNRDLEAPSFFYKPENELLKRDYNQLAIFNTEENRYDTWVSLSKVEQESFNKSQIVVLPQKLSEKLLPYLMEYKVNIDAISHLPVAPPDFLGWLNKAYGGNLSFDASLSSQKNWENIVHSLSSSLIKVEIADLRNLQIVSVDGGRGWFPAIEGELGELVEKQGEYKFEPIAGGESKVESPTITKIEQLKAVETFTQQINFGGEALFGGKTRRQEFIEDLARFGQIGPSHIDWNFKGTVDLPSQATVSTRINFSDGGGWESAPLSISQGHMYQFPGRRVDAQGREELLPVRRVKVDVDKSKLPADYKFPSDLEMEKKFILNRDFSFLNPEEQKRYQEYADKIKQAGLPVKEDFPFTLSAPSSSFLEIKEDNTWNIVAFVGGDQEFPYLGLPKFGAFSPDSAPPPSPYPSWLEVTSEGNVPGLMRLKPHSRQEGDRVFPGQAAFVFKGLPGAMSGGLEFGIGSETYSHQSLPHPAYPWSKLKGRISYEAREIRGKATVIPVLFSGTKFTQHHKPEAIVSKTTPGDNSGRLSYMLISEDVEVKSDKPFTWTGHNFLFSTDSNPSAIGSIGALLADVHIGKTGTISIPEIAVGAELYKGNYKVRSLAEIHSSSLKRRLAKEWGVKDNLAIKKLSEGNLLTKEQIALIPQILSKKSLSEDEKKIINTYQAAHRAISQQEINQKVEGLLTKAEVSLDQKLKGLDWKSPQAWYSMADSIAEKNKEGKELSLGEESFQKASQELSSQETGVLRVYQEYHGLGSAWGKETNNDLAGWGFLSLNGNTSTPRSNMFFPQNFDPQAGEVYSSFTDLFGGEKITQSVLSQGPSQQDTALGQAARSTSDIFTNLATTRFTQTYLSSRNYGFMAKGNIERLFGPGGSFMSLEANPGAKFKFLDQGNPLYSISDYTTLTSDGKWEKRRGVFEIKGAKAGTEGEFDFAPGGGFLPYISGEVQGLAMPGYRYTRQGNKETVSGFGKWSIDAQQGKFIPIYNNIIQSYPQGTSGNFDAYGLLGGVASSGGVIYGKLEDKPAVFAFDKGKWKVFDSKINDWKELSSEQLEEINREEINAVFNSQLGAFVDQDTRQIIFSDSFRSPSSSGGSSSVGGKTSLAPEVEAAVSSIKGVDDFINYTGYGKWGFRGGDIFSLAPDFMDILIEVSPSFKAAKSSLAVGQHKAYYLGKDTQDGGRKSNAVSAFWMGEDGIHWKNTKLMNKEVTLDYNDPKVRMALQAGVSPEDIQYTSLNLPPTLVKDSKTSSASEWRGIMLDGDNVPGKINLEGDDYKKIIAHKGEVTYQGSRGVLEGKFSEKKQLKGNTRDDFVQLAFNGGGIFSLYDNDQLQTDFPLSVGLKSLEEASAKKVGEETVIEWKDTGTKALFLSLPIESKVQKLEFLLNTSLGASPLGKDDSSTSTAEGGKPPVLRGGEGENNIYITGNENRDSKEGLSLRSDPLSYSAYKWLTLFSDGKGTLPINFEGKPLLSLSGLNFNLSEGVNFGRSLEAVKINGRLPTIRTEAILDNEANPALNLAYTGAFKGQDWYGLEDSSGKHSGYATWGKDNSYFEFDQEGKIYFKGDSFFNDSLPGWVRPTSAPLDAVGFIEKKINNEVYTAYISPKVGVISIEEKKALIFKTAGRTASLSGDGPGGSSVSWVPTESKVQWDVDDKLSVFTSLDGYSLELAIPQGMPQLQAYSIATNPGAVGIKPGIPLAVDTNIKVSVGFKVDQQGKVNYSSQDNQASLAVVSKGGQEFALRKGESTRVPIGDLEQEIKFDGTDLKTESIYHNNEELQAVLEVGIDEVGIDNKLQDKINNYIDKLEVTIEIDGLLKKADELSKQDDITGVLEKLQSVLEMKEITTELKTDIQE